MHTRTHIRPAPPPWPRKKAKHTRFPVRLQGIGVAACSRHARKPDANEGQVDWAVSVWGLGVGGSGEAKWGEGAGFERRVALLRSVVCVLFVCLICLHLALLLVGGLCFFFFFGCVCVCVRMCMGYFFK